jgi:hypothetical protein
VFVLNHCGNAREFANLVDFFCVFVEFLKTKRTWCHKITMGGCAVPGCNGRTNKGQQLFRYPTDKTRREVWIKSIKPPNRPTDHSRICEVN